MAVLEAKQNIIDLITLFIALLDSIIAKYTSKKVDFFEVNTRSLALIIIYCDPYFLDTDTSAYLNDPKSVNPSPVMATL